MPVKGISGPPLSLNLPEFGLVAQIVNVSSLPVPVSMMSLSSFRMVPVAGLPTTEMKLDTTPGPWAATSLSVTANSSSSS